MSSNYNQFPWRETHRGDDAEPRNRFGFTGFQTMPEIPESGMQQTVAAGVAAQAATMMALPNAPALQQHSSDMMERLVEITRRRLHDELFRPSPLLYRIRSSEGVANNGGTEMQVPIQYQLPAPVSVDVNASPGTLYWSRDDPMELPDIRQHRAVHVSETVDWPTVNFAYPGARLAYDAGPSARELDLQHRLNQVREALGIGARNRILASVSFVERDGPGMMQSLRLGSATMEQLNEALDFDAAPVQDSDSYVYRYEFVNGQTVKVDEKLSGGTILDAAARVGRKFRLVEE